MVCQRETEMTTATGWHEKQKYKSPLHEMTQTTPTCLWNDSAALDELNYSIEHGGVGATCNPVIVLDVLKKEAHLWNDRIRALAEELPSATEDQIAWETGRGDLGGSLTASFVHFPKTEGQERTTLHPNRSSFLPGRGRDYQSGRGTSAISAPNMIVEDSRSLKQA